ncbi:YhgE/Pip family protein [Actinophytocola oryzae]|uniref:YhgE/Pip family protein n=1 Tax=Actinophytocola oryzae TaxID=502181 RepID=UPI001414EBDA|nr:YhgE/Pip domain-containing protein [Actinophytocola oryzae]
MAWFEIKRFRTPLQRLALAFVVLVPLLYGGLYLWSNWDPYGRLDQIPVAVVNEDRAVTVNGQQVDAGKLFVDELRKDRIFDWHFVDRAEAARGVHDTDYYFQISVPRDFSRKLASGAEATPQRARMLITLDDANGYIVGKMAQTVQASLENKISAAAVSAYFQSVFDNLESLRAGIHQAADGAGQLRDGAATAEQGSATLASGIGDLKAGADELAPGAQQVSDGVSAIANVVVPAANTIADALPSFTQDAATAASAADSLAGAAAQTADTVAGGADSVQSRVTAVGQAHPELQADPGYQELVRVTGQAAGFANQVDASATALRTTTASVNAHAQQLAADAPRLQSEVRGAATQISQLDSGAKQVASGAAQLDDGLGTAATGATSLHDGVAKLSSGAASLASGLSDAETRIPVLSDDQKKTNAATLASPVDVATENLHPAVTYGRGLTPFFFAIALVVFGITAFLILRPISARALASRAGDVTVALAGWLPAATCCVVGGLVLFLVLDVFLGLDPTLAWAMIGLVVLAAAAFTAIAHLFRTWLGGVASAVVLVLLLLQLTACAGTYPYETLPGFFRALHWVLPMTYFVDGLRVTTTGGNTAHLVRDALVLAGFLLVALALTTLVVHREREWTIAKLKPDLSL